MLLADSQVPMTPFLNNYERPLREENAGGQNKTVPNIKGVAQDPQSI